MVLEPLPGSCLDLHAALRDQEDPASEALHVERA
jgi:hypothetical protein